MTIITWNDENWFKRISETYYKIGSIRMFKGNFFNDDKYA